MIELKILDWKEDLTLEQFEGTFADRTAKTNGAIDTVSSAFVSGWNLVEDSIDGFIVVSPTKAREVIKVNGPKSVFLVGDISEAEKIVRGVR